MTGREGRRALFALLADGEHPLELRCRLATARVAQALHAHPLSRPTSPRTPTPPPGQDVYVGVLPGSAAKATSSARYAPARALWADCDSAAAGRQARPVRARADRDRPLGGLDGDTLKRHAYWRLADPLPAADVRRTRCGSRTGSPPTRPRRMPADPARPRQPPSTRPGASLRLERFTGERTRSSELTGGLPDARDTGPPTSPPKAKTAGELVDLFRGESTHEIGGRHEPYRSVVGVLLRRCDRLPPDVLLELAVAWAQSPHAAVQAARRSWNATSTTCSRASGPGGDRHEPWRTARRRRQARRAPPPDAPVRDLAAFIGRGYGLPDGYRVARVVRYGGRAGTGLAVFIQPPGEGAEIRIRYAREEDCTIPGKLRARAAADTRGLDPRRPYQQPEGRRWRCTRRCARWPTHSRPPTRTARHGNGRSSSTGAPRLRRRDRRLPVGSGGSRITTTPSALSRIRRPTRIASRSSRCRCCSSTGRPAVHHRPPHGVFLRYDLGVETPALTIGSSVGSSRSAGNASRPAVGQPGADRADKVVLVLYRLPRHDHGSGDGVMYRDVQAHGPVPDVQP